MLKKKKILINTLIFIAFFGFFFSALMTISLYIQHSRGHSPVAIRPQPETPTPAPTMPVQQQSTIYGVNVDMGQILPSSSNYIVNNKNEDLVDIAGRLGINLIRITNGNGGKSGGIYTKKEWDEVLNKMQRKGIKAIVLIESPTIYQRLIPQTYLQLVQNYVIDSGVLEHTNIYGVDLYNEPIITAQNLLLMKKGADLIRTKYPQTHFTVGWWGVDTLSKDDSGYEIYRWDDYAAGKQLENLIDFYSLHLYGFEKTSLGTYRDPYLYTKNFITAVKDALQTTKPILIEEFGVANGDSVSNEQTIGSPRLQANVYGEVYQAILDMHDPQLLGTTAYQLHSRSKDPDAWAITKDNGNTFFPAAYVLQKYATGKSDVEINLPLTPIPNDLLLTTDDTNRTLDLQIDDIVGLNLSLDQNKTYSLSLSNPSVFLTSEKLTLDSDNNKYYAVFHAIQPGQGNITVVDNQGKTVFTSDFIIK